MKKIFLSKGGVMVFILAAVLAVSGCTLTAKNVLSPEDAKAKALDFITNNLVQPGTEISIKEITEEEIAKGLNMYKITVNAPNDQEVDIYMTKDGKKYIPQVLDIAEVIEEIQGSQNGQNAQVEPPAPAPKSDKPVVELFVMSFCPYGVQAGNVMKPVFDLLGEKADIQLRHIASLQGDDLASVKSLHGVIEGMEGARQLCVAETYGKKTLWNYVMNINEECYAIYMQGDEQYNTCWKKSARDAGMDPNKLDACMAQKGAELIKAEDEAAKKYGVTGSPSLVINGQKVNPSRTPEGYKTAICDAFNEPPAECSQVLSEAGAAAEGGC